MLSRLSARTRMRVAAVPLRSTLARSSRSTMVSVPPSSPGRPVATGTPRSAILPVKASDREQKKPAGMGSLAKSAKVEPLARVCQRSIPPSTAAAAARVGTVSKARDKINSGSRTVRFMTEILMGSRVWRIDNCA